MKISRRTLTWAAIGAVPVLTAFAFAGTNFVSTHEAKVSSSTSVHQAASAVPQVQVASALGHRRLHLKRGHTYQLSTTEMASVVGANTSYAPGSSVTLPSSFGNSGLDGSVGANGNWIILDDNNDDGVGASYNRNGWLMARRTASTLTISIPQNAVPSTYTAFWKTGTTTLSSSRTQLSITDPIGGNGPSDVGQIAKFTVN